MRSSRKLPTCIYLSSLLSPQQWRWDVPIFPKAKCLCVGNKKRKEVGRARLHVAGSSLRRRWDRDKLTLRTTAISSLRHKGFSHCPELTAPCNPRLLVTHQLSQQQQLTLKPCVNLWEPAHISQEDLEHSWHFVLSYSWEAAYSCPNCFCTVKGWREKEETFPHYFLLPVTGYIEGFVL